MPSETLKIEISKIGREKIRGLFREDFGIPVGSETAPKFHASQRKNPQMAVEALQMRCNRFKYAG